jgi:hypothetical protein
MRHQSPMCECRGACRGDADSPRPGRSSSLRSVAGPVRLHYLSSFNHDEPVDEPNGMALAQPCSPAPVISLFRHPHVRSDGRR